MTVLSRLFRQDPPPTRTPEDERAGLPTLAPESLVGVALGNGDETLRIAAIGMLDNVDALWRLAAPADPASAPAAIRRAARTRLGQLLDSGALTLDQLRQRDDDIATRLAIAGHAGSPAYMEQLIAEITDEEHLAELALIGATPSVRQLAAGKVQDEAIIGRLLKDARGKDKNVYRILKSKRDTQHAAQRAAAERLVAATTLCATIEHHSHQPFNNLFGAAVEHLQRQWQESASDAPAELQARATIALDRCREIVDRHRDQLAAEAARAAAIDAAVLARSELLQALPALLAKICDAATAVTEPELALPAQRWAELTAVCPPNRDQQATFVQLTRAIAELSAFNAQHGSVQQLSAALNAEAVAPLRRALGQMRILGDAIPESAAAATATLVAWEQARATEAESASAALRQVSGLLRKAQAALAGGQSRQAAGMRRALEDKLSHSPELPAHLASQLQSFDARLSALQDWRSFAVAPKRVELIEQMEALIGATDAPTALADRIKRLQDEWKLISKGNTEDTEAEWQRFHEAAQKAYEPCRAFFAAQAQVRADNLDKRSALLARLQDFVAAQNWEQVDWREVARALRESRQQWRTLQPVERAANKPLQQAFESLTADLQTRLDGEYTRNVAAKRALIARVQQLAAADDGRQAGEEVKRLQLDWKDIGLVPQEVSQSLWEEFRQHCDAVFANRQQQHTEFATQLAANGTRAAELCAEVEQLASLSGQELIEAVRRAPALRETFDAAGELPRADAYVLRNRLERALSRCEQKLAEQRANDRARGWDRVFEADDLIRAYRQSLAGGLDSAIQDERLQQAKSLLESDVHWPKGMLKVLTAEMARQPAADPSANEATLRLLCIRAELLTDVPTPQQDEALRRDWQMQQLVKGLGQARPTRQEVIEELIRAWLATGAAAEPAHAPLRERFVRCHRLAVGAPEGTPRGGASAKR